MRFIPYSKWKCEVHERKNKKNSWKQYVILLIATISFSIMRDVILIVRRGNVQHSSFSFVCYNNASNEVSVHKVSGVIEIFPSWYVFVTLPNRVLCGIGNKLSGCS